MVSSEFPEATKSALAQAEAYVNEAEERRSQARQLLEKAYDYKGSALASQASIERSAKAVCTLLDVSFPRKHYFVEATIQQVLERLPSGACEYQNLLRLFLLANVWAPVHIITEYPFKYPRAAEDLKRAVKREEAELALKHTWECYQAASDLLSFTKRELEDSE